MTTPVTKILVANRGEIAVRVIRTSRDLGIASVAVYSDQDMHSLTCDLADEAISLGGTAPATTYLSSQALVKAATQVGADAIHPGYGFLSENADFAQDVIEAGITWLGPKPQAIRDLGDKISARNIAQSVDVPVIPGEELSSDPAQALTQITAIAAGHDYPVLVKRADAGGGRGITRLDSDTDAQRFIADLPATDAAGNHPLTGCFVEKMVTFARHVETQCMRDTHGNFAVVTTRDCSVQRRNQKVIEEAPAPHLPSAVENELLRCSQLLFEAVDYVGVGTCEFLVTNSGRVYFLEVNPRLQVEHTVSEEVTGLDLVEQQIRIARGEKLPDVPSVRGHSFEVRITSENPADDLMPATGTITGIRWPGGPGVRVDSFIRPGDSIGSDYDSLIAKLIVTGATRAQALTRLVRAINEFHVDGLPTCAPLLKHLLTHPDFCGPDSPLSFISEATAPSAPAWPTPSSDFAVYTKWMEDKELLAQVKDSLVKDTPTSTTRTSASGIAAGATASADDLATFIIEIDGKRVTLRLPNAMLARPSASPAVAPGSVPMRPQALRGRGRGRTANGTAAATSGPSLTAPIQATVVRLAVEVGQSVTEGDLVIVLESMKMEKPITATASGIISDIHVGAGDTVKAGDLMVTITPSTDSESPSTQEDSQ